MPIALLLYPITGTLNPLASLRSWLGAGDMVEKKSTAYWTGDMIGIFADGGLAARMLVGLFKFSKTAITCWKRGDSLFETLRIEREFAQAQREIAKARKAEQKRLPKAQKAAQKENPLGVYGMHEYDYPKDYFGEKEILEKINEMERKYVKETGHQIQPYADRGLHGVDDATYGKIDPFSGQIYLFDYKKENLFAKAEELLHYQQLKECNAIGKTEEELGSKFIEWMERDVVDRLEKLGFTKRRR